MKVLSASRKFIMWEFGLVFDNGVTMPDVRESFEGMVNVGNFVEWLLSNLRSYNNFIVLECNISWFLICTFALPKQYIPD